MNSKLEEFLFYSAEATNVDNLFSLYSNFLDSYGFDQLGYAIASDHKEIASDVELGLVNHNMVNDWVEHYRENGYLEVDKTTHLLRANQGIYNWQDTVQRGDLSPLQCKIFDEANEAKMYQGNSISVHGPKGVIGVMIASSSQSSCAPTKHHLNIINVASYHFHLCFLSLVQSTHVSYSAPLTLKEQEVLKWLSTGMTKQEIASKVDVSVHTVDFHSRNILRKMDAKNMTSALVTAIKEGLLIL